MAAARKKSTGIAMSSALPPLAIERISCHLSGWMGEAGRCQWCNAEIVAARRRTWCSDQCGRAWQRNHIWRFARATAKRRAKYRCTREGCDAARRDCEVNHVEPRNGGGYGPGCHHHLDAGPDGRGGLEVLCRRHHAEVTALQASMRAAARRAQKAASTDETTI